MTVTNFLNKVLMNEMPVHEMTINKMTADKMPLAATSRCLFPGSTKANGREPKTCLGRVFNFKLGCFNDVHVFYLCGRTPTSKVENSAQA